MRRLGIVLGLALVVGLVLISVMNSSDDSNNNSAVNHQDSYQPKKQLPSSLNGSSIESTHNSKNRLPDGNESGSTNSTAPDGISEPANSTDPIDPAFANVTSDRTSENPNEMVSDKFKVVIRFTNGFKKNIPLTAQVKKRQDNNIWSINPIAQGTGNAKGDLNIGLPGPGDFKVNVQARGREFTFEGQITEATPEWTVQQVIKTGSRLEGALFHDGGQELITAGRVWGQKDLAIELFPLDGSKAGQLKVKPKSDGTYLILDVPDGRYAFVVRKKYYATFVTVSGNTYFNADLPMGRVEGRIVDVNGKPAPYVQVVIQKNEAPEIDEELKPFLKTKTLSDRVAPDKEGRYVFSNLPPGTYRMFANGGGFGNVHGKATVKDGEVTNVDFEMVKGASINLSITDTDEKPLKEVLCSCAGIIWGFTGTAGGLKAGTFDVMAFAKGYGVAVNEKVKFPAGEVTAVAFKLEKSIETSLIVKGADGELLKDVVCTVHVGSHDVQKFCDRTFSRIGLGSHPFMKTGEDGRIALMAYSVGTYSMTLTKKGFENWTGPVTIKEGQKVVNVTLAKN